MPPPEVSLPLGLVPPLPPIPVLPVGRSVVSEPLGRDVSEPLVPLVDEPGVDEPGVVVDEPGAVCEPVPLGLVVDVPMPPELVPL